MMKQNYLILLAVVMSCVFFSCKDPVELSNDNNKNVEVNFTVEGVQDNEEVFGTLTLKVTPKENSDLEKVSFYVGSSLIGEDSDAPFELEWNTLDHEDGEYAVIVEGVAGDESHKVDLDVEIVNVLADIVLKDFNASVYLDVYAFASDNEGNQLGDYVTVELEESVKLFRPEGFTGSQFNFNLVTVETGDINYMRVMTYANMDAGDVKLDKLYDEIASPSQGEVIIKLYNAPETVADNIDFLSSEDNNNTSWSDYSQEDGYFQANVQLYKAQDKIYISYNDRREKVNKFFMTDMVAPGDVLTIDYNDFESLTKEAFSINGMYLSHIFGLGRLEELDSYYDVGLDVVDPSIGLSAAYPSGVFESISWGVYTVPEDFSYYQYQRFVHTPPSTISPLSFGLTSVEVSADQFSGTIDGDYDFFMAQYNGRNNTENGTYSYTRSYYGEGKDVDVQMPELPQELQTNYEGFKMTEPRSLWIYVTKVDDWDGLTSFTDGVLRNGEGINIYRIFNSEDFFLTPYDATLYEIRLWSSVRLSGDKQNRNIKNKFQDQISRKKNLNLIE